MKAQRIVREPYEKWPQDRNSSPLTPHSLLPKTWNLEPLARAVELIFMLGAVLGALYFLWAVTSSAMDLIWQGVNGQLIRWS